ncbi:MAG: hypothetical protein ACREXY_26140, partial [Gammaproteobacteria bacterium]
MKALALMAVLAIHGPWLSDPDVDAARWSPKVRVEVGESRSSQSDRPADSRLPTSDPKPPPCYQAPGAKASGFSCALENFPGTFSPLPMDVDSTPGDVERAIREVPMPALQLKIQPDGETLVN